MHYITGTNFSVRPDPKRSFRARENEFIPNTLYTLFSIAKHADGLEYTFRTTDKVVNKMIFTTGREADEFIASIRKEQLPDYSRDIGKVDG